MFEFARGAFARLTEGIEERKNKNMKAKNLKRIETLTAALLLTLLLGCGPSKPTEAENKEAFAEATAAANAPAAPATPAVTPAATPAAPATPEATPAATPPAAAAPAATTPAAGMVRYDASPTGSKMRMEGTSTLHDWHMESTIIGGFLEAEPGFPASSSKATVQVFTPVRSYKSSGGKKMDQVMQEHMKEPQFKMIKYSLIELKPKSPAGASGPVQFEAVGALTILNNTVTNTIPVTVEKMADGKIKVVGSTPLKMTDYKLPPPEISLLGMAAIKVGDDLQINFEWVLAPKAL